PKAIANIDIKTIEKVVYHSGSKLKLILGI
ncbi:unnamed protein product, partial [marine sediment metagenome]